MPSFGRRSRENLEDVHPDMIMIAEFVIKQFDFTVTSGNRSAKEQNELFKKGVSTKDGYNRLSKHQGHQYDDQLSRAIDIAPYPIDFSSKRKKLARFYMCAGYFFQASHTLHSMGLITHKLRWGGDWDGDKDFEDQTFDDLGHFELI